MGTTKNKKPIQFLRSEEKTFAEVSLETKDLVLSAGQPYFNVKDNDLYIGDGTTAIKDLTAINAADNIVFTKDIYTAYSIGSISASSNNRKVLFSKGDNLLDRLDAIFDVTVQPTINAPNLTISVSSNKVTGELGSSWPSITTSTTRTNGSYSFGPADTGVTWNDDLNITQSGNTAGVFGSGSRAYKATQSYTATGVIALDNKGNLSNPEKKITSGSDESTVTVSETVQYRYFYGNVAGSTINEILTNLKNITASTDSLKTFLAKQFSITVTLSANGYIYFISKDVINGASMGGFEFPITKIGTANFTNSYDKSYSVNVYLSSSELTPGTYTISLT